jgi:hypothetical protein
LLEIKCNINSQGTGIVQYLINDMCSPAKGGTFSIFIGKAGGL